jgi:hypothetical protein
MYAHGQLTVRLDRLQTMGVRSHTDRQTDGYVGQSHFITDTARALQYPLRHEYAAAVRPFRQKLEHHWNTTKATNLAKCGSAAIPCKISIGDILRLFKKDRPTRWRSRPPWAETLSQIRSTEEHQAN